MNPNETTKMFSLMVALAVTLVAHCSGTVLTFDDLPDPGENAPAVPDGYGSIDWSQGGWCYFSEVQPPYTAHSGPDRVFSYNADNRFYFSQNAVIFDGAWFAGGSNYDDGTPTNDKVTFDLYYHGKMVATSNSLAVSSVPAFLSSGYQGLVDAVGITETVLRPANTDFVMDDVTFHATDTPEPSALGLLAMAILCLSFRKSRSIMLIYRGAAGICLLLIGLLFEAAPARADLLYATKYDGSVAQIDTVTGATSTYVSGLSGGAGGLAFDSVGNLYVTDYGDNSIVRFAPDRTSSVFATGLDNPAGLAIDPKGNVYVVNYLDDGLGSIDRFSPNGVRSVFASGLNGPINMVFDQSGDMLEANYTAGTIDRITPNGVVSIFADGLNGPVGLALDAGGNLYVSTDSDASNQQILRYTPQGTASVFASTSPYYPDGLAFDSSGNLYAGHDGDGLITRITPTGSQTTLSTGTDLTTSFLAVRPTVAPEPSGVLLSCVGAGLLIVGRRVRFLRHVSRRAPQQ